MVRPKLAESGRAASKKSHRKSRPVATDLTRSIQIANAHPQRCLIGIGQAVVEAQSADAKRAAAAPLTHLVRVLNLAHERVAKQASELFCENVMQNVLVKAQIGPVLHEHMVLVIELLQPPQLDCARAAVKLHHAVECLLGDSHPPQHLCDRCPGLGLLRRKCDLLLGELTLLHDSAPPIMTSRN